jgi:hypothetical protein
MSGKVEYKPRSKRDKAIQAGMTEVFPYARPGMKVRCLVEMSGLLGIVGPHEGEVYTIRELRRGLWKAWAAGFTLEEIINEIDPEQGSEPFFDAGSFEII